MFQICQFHKVILELLANDVHDEKIKTVFTENGTEEIISLRASEQEVQIRQNKLILTARQGNLEPDNYFVWNESK